MAAEAKITIKQVSPSASESRVRGHVIPCDRPEDKGGGNHGPMGGELFLSGFGGCFMSNLLAAIAARNAPVKDVSIDITGTIDGSPQRFAKVEAQVSAAYEDRDEMEKLLVIAERGCIVANTIKHSLELEIRLL